MKCPECKNKLYECVDQESGFIQSICWACGHYQDNSPAYSLDPDSFKNLVRNNPIHFMKKFAHQPTVNTKNESTDEDTEPTD